MHKQGDEIHVSESEASGGRKTGRMRWVLGAGLAVAVVALAIIWMTGAATQDDADSQVNVTNETGSASTDDGDGTDSIVSDEFETVNASAADQPSNAAPAE